MHNTSVLSHKKEGAASFLNKLRHDRRGVITVMFALLIPFLIGMVGLGLELGIWFESRRDLQTAADAAAIAGAYEVQDSTATAASILATATTDATSNGYDVSTDTITAVNPPDTGPNTSDDTAVEVNMSRTVTSLFAQQFLGDSINIAARAVAHTGGSDDTACVLSLSTTGTGISVSGNGDIAFDGCQVASNSSDGSSLDVSGNGDLVTDCYTTVGGVTATDGLDVDDDCEPTTGSPTIADPLGDLTAPDEACDDDDGYSFNTNGGSETIDGNYDTVNGIADYDDAYVICGDFSVQNGTVTLQPGLYVIDGGDFSVGAQGSLVGEGVAIVLRNEGQINRINGSASVQLSAPNSTDGADEWEGILFYQDRETTSECTGSNCNRFNGGSTTEFEGTIYFPKQAVFVNGGNDSSLAVDNCLQIIALEVGFSGNSDIVSDNAACSAAGVAGIPLPGVVALIE